MEGQHDAAHRAHQESAAPPATLEDSPGGGGRSVRPSQPKACLSEAQLSCRKPWASGAPSMTALMHTCRHACVRGDGSG